MSRWLIAVACSSCVAAIAARAPEVAPDGPTASTTASSYNVYSTIQRTGSPRAAASATLIFARQDPRRFCFARFTRESTSLYRVEDGRVRDLHARGPSAIPVADESRAIVLKRRPGEIVVEADGSMLAHAWDDGLAAGDIGVGADTTGVEVRDLYAQEIADIAFEDDFAATPLASNAAETAAPAWTPLQGEWRIAFRRDPLVARQNGPIAASWYEAAGQAVRLSVAGHDFWENYAAEASLQSDADTWAGIAFAVRGPEDFCAFAFAPTSDLPVQQAGGAGVARVLAVERGQPRVLSSARFAAKPGQWYRLRVESFGHSARGLINGEEVLSATAPFSSGKAGLYSEGPGLARFDDVSVESIRIFADGFDNGAGAWRWVEGRWRAGKGSLTPSAGGANLATTYTPWTDFDYAADVTVKAGESAGLAFRDGAGAHYAFTLDRAKRQAEWRLSLDRGDETTELARGEAPQTENAHRRLQVAADGGRITCAIDGYTVAMAYDFSLPGGRLGLIAQGRGCVFANVAAHSRHEPEPVVVSVADASGRTVPWGVDGSMVPLLGSLWQAPRGSWVPGHATAAQAVLVPRLTGGRAELWYRDVCPGDAGLVAETAALPDGGHLALTICSQDASDQSGYTLSASGGRFGLQRNGLDVGTPASLPPADRGGVRWELFRDGPFVVASVNASHLVYGDEAPLPPGRAGVSLTGSSVAVSSVELTNRSAIAYRFDRVEPDWEPTAGEWVTHSGMACIPWDYWLTGFGRPRAFIWNRHVLPSDEVVTVHVSEYTEGEETGEHRHFPYHDVNLVICGRAPDPDSGYRFVIGGDGGRFVRLYRRGELVQESQDARFRITMGPHCNSPRAIGVVAPKTGGHLQLFLQGVLALDFHDPDPLPGGQVALGVEGCDVNFRDFIAYAEQPAAP